MPGSGGTPSNPAMTGATQGQRSLPRKSVKQTPARRTERIFQGEQQTAQ